MCRKHTGDLRRRELLAAAVGGGCRSRLGKARPGSLCDSAGSVLLHACGVTRVREWPLSMNDCCPVNGQFTHSVTQSRCWQHRGWNA